ncbi:Pam17p Ecym_5181 [Eremothecium cymbalariae DBVPG|uniref:Presequence translocated-associated motor subunit PAM17 n=1 Tax=Eremothecium cymbalariae (strain CBS 270.75 / DBVPG 7215 / KCTC 17166 / NRRL Y-17582) TaxID=931890 RepID=I6ND12_ERECY|nr:hypothetical protein Ecym_5181 [Eremothecium cymbalariae DBVPG\
MTEKTKSLVSQWFQENAYGTTESRYQQEQGPTTEHQAPSTTVSDIACPSIFYTMSLQFVAKSSVSKVLGARSFSQFPCLLQQKSDATAPHNNHVPNAEHEPGLLTWIDFFKLRKQERRINTGSSVFTALIGTQISWAYLSTMQIDPMQTIFGFDPLVVICGTLAASGGLGFLCGPIVGSWLFKLKHKHQLASYTVKNKAFLQHIKDNRVDASSQSFSNPVPDYYGERISSLKEYRQWLRDCHSHRRKAKEFL